jgi:hypothetical protein
VTTKKFARRKKKNTRATYRGRLTPWRAHPLVEAPMSVTVLIDGERLASDILMPGDITGFSRFRKFVG